MPFVVIKDTYVRLLSTDFRGSYIIKFGNQFVNWQELCVIYFYDFIESQEKYLTRAYFQITEQGFVFDDKNALFLFM